MEDEEKIMDPVTADILLKAIIKWQAGMIISLMLIGFYVAWNWPRQKRRGKK